ncbi:SusD/RagB family nutrient-binding outer membrane lipoprotein [Hymenobacter sp. HD11105]
MKISKIPVSIALIAVLAGGAGCEKFLDVNTDPINPVDVNIDLLMTTTQASMGIYLGHNVLGLSQYTSAIMQQITNGRIGTYGLTGETFNNPWQGLYTNALSNNEAIIEKGTATNAWTHVGVAQIQKAHVFSQMVDVWGDIPYSEALRGAQTSATNFNAPRFDDDAEIYADLFRLIDEGIANLQRTDASRPLGGDDLIYGGNRDKWIRLGNTLKLKLYNQVRLVQDVRAQVTPLLTQNLITADDDFEFRFGTGSGPENRHPGFQGDYAGSGRENGVNRFFYDLMRTTGGTTPDPRIPYYFFNQYTLNTPSAIADYQDGRFITVQFGSNGPQANTNNANVRTLQGLYPIGGRYDNGAGLAAGATGASARGNVPQRFITFFARKFIEAELQLMVLGNQAAARTAFSEAVTASFNKINSIITTTNPQDATQSYTVPQIPAATITAYVTAALARYDAAVGDEAKLNVIMTEKYIANYGTGTDVYTDYRRTGYPRIPYSDLPAYTGTVQTGAFPVRLTYRNNDLLTNQNAPAQPNVTTDKVFWDK